MFIDANTSRIDLEGAIVGDADLYRQFDEPKLLSGGYSTDEMREIVIRWIEEGDECA